MILTGDTGSLIVTVSIVHRINGPSCVIISIPPPIAFHMNRITRICTLAVLLALDPMIPIRMSAVPIARGDDAPAKLQEGAAIFQAKCAECHGTKGQGVEGIYPKPLTGDLTVQGLARIISETMPEGSPESCIGQEAETIADWLHAEIYGESAQMRQHPPRVMLSRLTAEQLRQSLSDLYASQTGLATWSTERGLQAQYFDAANFKQETKKVDRIDSLIDFDFGRDGPGEGITPEEYGIVWKGGLLIEESGTYEVVMRSSCSFTFQLGDYGHMFIDNHVQSGDKTEFRKIISLTGGRVYPLRINFRQRKRKTEQPPANISLSWVPPGRVEEVVPARNLIPASVPPAFALQTYLPPDDRSYGFQRGIAVDTQWDEAVTAAALEFADAAATDLWPRFQKQAPDSEDRSETLSRFLTAMIESAFRCPLDDTTLELYIERQITNTDDELLTIRRSLLAALKSPRFLYPLLDSNQSVSQRNAIQLTLTLMDSLPADQWLLETIDRDALITTEQLRSAATRLMGDFRVRHKTRTFVAEWLNVSEAKDYSKDEKLFPGFDGQLTGELHASLFEFVDSVIWDDASDFRRLFMSATPLQSKVAQTFYTSIQPTEEEASDPTSAGDFQAELGILGHPYLMSRLAYRDSTSPIHRGVFVLRHLLGRTLRPPQEAFTPLSPKLHPDLTTRERIHLQTSPENCQGCHTRINGLGFVLENLDAVGRYRAEEGGKPIDSHGVYVTRSGQPVRFSGPEDLASFLADSDDAQRAFAQRAFLHFVKQPPGAWGPQTLDRLTTSFRHNQFNVQSLLIEIAMTALTTPVQPSGTVDRTQRTNNPDHTYEP